MKNIWTNIKIALKFIPYYLYTNDERVAYMLGMNKGMHVTKVRNGVLGGFTVYYDKNKKPVREYVTWAEFKDYQLRKGEKK